MKADQGIALVRTLESIAPLAQINPGVLDRINADEALKLLAEVNGLPARILVSDREMQAKQEAAAQAQQAQALLQAAPVAADTARTMVETANMARGGATPL
jgi:pyruvate carboxylase